MGMQTGIQRLAAVIKWLSIAAIALGVWTGTQDRQGTGLLMFVFFAIPGGAGLLLAYVLGGFGERD